VLGVWVTLLRDPDDASEVFSQACEDLWAGLPRFERRASLRTWFYTLARHAASRLRRAPHRDPRRAIPLSEASSIAERVRSRTLPHLRSEVKDVIASIRDSLDEADRALLVLRIDRSMSWNDLARVLGVENESDEALARAAARLRKRFQLLKVEIRERARAAGLLSDDDS
jgi:RNA polymerase sigma-70 factor (ECF subfamily)